jgi:hypothetical protein
MFIPAWMIIGAIIFVFVVLDRKDKDKVTAKQRAYEYKMNRERAAALNYAARHFHGKFREDREPLPHCSDY